MGCTERLIRCDVHYSGHVQGVGFRYAVLSIAKNHAVTGSVQNLPDGRVHLVAEGPGDEVEALLAAVADTMQDRIRDINCQHLPPTGGFSRFKIKHEL